MKKMQLVENATTEFKRQYTDDIKKSIVAFANTAGGVIYIGIADDGSITGIADQDDTILRVTNMVRDAIRPDVTLFVTPSFETMEGKEIVMVTVEKGTASPYYLSGKGLRPEGVYVRQGASSVPASETAIRNMIKATDGDKYEAVRSLNQELTLHAAEKEFVKREVPFGPEQMRTLKLINANGIYTNLALLLSDQCVHTIKLAVYEGGEKEVFRDRREFEGSLLAQLREVYEFLDRYNRVHAEVKGLSRIDTRDYPEEALREALLNALVHREYSFSGSTLISVFDDRIEFVSIGGLAPGITLEDIMLGISLSRNENLANIFYRLGLIEAYGTGIPKMIRSYAGHPVQPVIETSDNAFKITLPNQNSDAVPPIAKESALSEREETVIALLETKESIVRTDVEEALSVSQGTATRMIREMLGKGLIRAVGQGKNTRYYKG